MATKSTREPKAPVEGEVVEAKPRKPEKGLTRQQSIARARASVMVEQSMRNVPMRVIAEQFNVSRDRVKQIIKWAEEKGIVEETRDRLKAELLPKSFDTFKQILDAPASLLADPAVLKGYELKVKVAKQISDGVGAFRKESSHGKVTEVRTLDWYLQQRQQPAVASGAAHELGDGGHSDLDALPAGDGERPPSDRGSEDREVAGLLPPAGDILAGEVATGPDGPRQSVAHEETEQD